MPATPAAQQPNQNPSATTEEAPKATEADKAQEAAEKAALEVAEAQTAAAEAQAKVAEARVKTAEEQVEAAKKASLTKDGKNKTTDDGRVIGLDGENPVSNTNPDPRAVRGTFVL